MKKLTSRSSCANHLSESFVTDVRHHRLRRIFLSEIGEKKKEPGELFFARVEKLINEVRLHSTIARQQIGQEAFCEIRLVMEDADHRRLIQTRNRAVDHRSRG